MKYGYVNLAPIKIYIYCTANKKLCERKIHCMVKLYQDKYREFISCSSLSLMQLFTKKSFFHDIKTESVIKWTMNSAALIMYFMMITEMDPSTTNFQRD